MPQLTPQLICESSVDITRTRSLPLAGNVLVRAGQEVNADQEIAQIPTAGELHILKISEALNCSPVQAMGAVRVQEGQVITAGQIIAERRALFGLFRSQYASPVTGKVEFINNELAHVGIRGTGAFYSLAAYIQGTVLNIIDGENEAGQQIVVGSHGTLVQGVFGVGGESSGKVVTKNASELVQALDVSSEELTGAVLVLSERISETLFKRLSSLNLRGLVVGSLDDTLVQSFTGTDISLALTGREQVPFPIIMTEGFGRAQMSPVIFSLLSKHEGSTASVSGVTQVRAGAIRPEIFIAHKGHSKKETSDGILGIGKKVRIVRGKLFGEFGIVTELPHQLQVLSSGTHALVAKVLLNNNTSAEIARVNLEIVQDS